MLQIICSASRFEACIDIQANALRLSRYTQKHGPFSILAAHVAAMFSIYGCTSATAMYWKLSDRFRCCMGYRTSLPGLSKGISLLNGKEDRKPGRRTKEISGFGEKKYHGSTIRSGSAKTCCDRDTFRRCRTCGVFASNKNSLRSMDLMRSVVSAGEGG